MLVVNEIERKKKPEENLQNAGSDKSGDEGKIRGKEKNKSEETAETIMESEKGRTRGSERWKRGGGKREMNIANWESAE